MKSESRAPKKKYERYKLIEKLGEGTFGKVYKAKGKHLYAWLPVLTISKIEPPRSMLPSKKCFSMKKGTEFQV